MTDRDRERLKAALAAAQMENERLHHEVETICAGREADRRYWEAGLANVRRERDLFAEQSADLTDAILGLEAQVARLEQENAQLRADWQLWLDAPPQDAWRALREQVTRLVAALRAVERQCPCGARPESPSTHPHVGGCPVGEALAERPAEAAQAAIFSEDCSEPR